MNICSILMAVGLAASTMTPAMAAGSVYDLPSSITVSNISVHAGYDLAGEPVTADNRFFPTLPSGYSEASIRVRDMGDGYAMGADVHTFPGGTIYAQPYGGSSLAPLEASANGSWSATLTNIGAASSLLYGSIELQNRSSDGCCVSAAVKFALGTEQYILSGRTFVQPFHGVILQPGESVQISLSLSALQSSPINGWADTEYSVFVTVFADVSAVPEPSTTPLLGCGLAAICIMRRRRQR